MEQLNFLGGVPELTGRVCYTSSGVFPFCYLHLPMEAYGINPGKNFRCMSCCTLWEHKFYKQLDNLKKHLGVDGFRMNGIADNHRAFYRHLTISIQPLFLQSIAEGKSPKEMEYTWQNKMSDLTREYAGFIGTLDLFEMPTIIELILHTQFYLGGWRCRENKITQEDQGLFFGVTSDWIKREKGYKIKNDKYEAFLMSIWPSGYPLTDRVEKDIKKWNRETNGIKNEVLRMNIPDATDLIQRAMIERGINPKREDVIR